MSGKPNRDRKAERHQATIDEIVEAAWRLSRVEGLSGLSMRAVADAVGMRPQSLYSYVASKSEIYDAMYAEGARQFDEALDGWERNGDPMADLKALGRLFMGFCTEDEARYHLLFQRTVPGFEPSAASFDISIASLARVQEHLATLGFDDPRDLDLFTAVGTGLADQQISNDPGGSRWVGLIDDAVEMFVRHVSARSPL